MSGDAPPTKSLFERFCDDSRERVVVPFERPRLVVAEPIDEKFANEQAVWEICRYLDKRLASMPDASRPSVVAAACLEYLEETTGSLLGALAVLTGLAAGFDMADRAERDDPLPPGVA